MVSVTKEDSIKDKNSKVERYLENASEATLRQALRFILFPNALSAKITNIHYLFQQIEDFDRMFKVV